MDFESKICAAANIDKNLKLRWLYEVDTTSTSCDQNSSSSTATTNADGNNGRLIRKRYHSMPFLLRNMIANGNSNISSSRRDNFDIKLFAISRLPAKSPIKHKSKKKKEKRKRVEAVEESPHKDKNKKKKLKHKSNNEDAEIGNSLNPSQYILLSSDTVSSLLNDIEDSKQSSTKSKKNKPVYFHYIFMKQQKQSNDDDNYTTVLQKIDDRKCPLCNFDCKNDKGLLNHCRMYHGATFEAAKTEEGQFHVVVRGIDTINIVPKHDNYVFVQPRLVGMQCKSSNNQKMSVPFLQRLHSNTATLDANKHKQKLTSLQSKRAPKSVISAYLPTDTMPLRQYYHPHTNLPMTNEEWKQTSDKDTDESWVYKMMDEMLEEFEDVTPKEKGFMKIWNRYIKCNHVIADKDMAMKCHDLYSRIEKYCLKKE